MPCPHCAMTTTVEQPRRTTLGYRTFRRRAYRRAFNERTGTPFNQVQAPTDIALLVVLWRLHDKLRLRDLAAMFLERGCTFTQETVRDGETRFAPLLTDQLRAKRRGLIGAKWHADETYIRVDGRWCSLYCAIDREGNLVDARLRETRDMDAAQRFFRQALARAGAVPQQVTTDGHDASPRAIRETRGSGVTHRRSRYKNKGIAHDRRAIKRRYYPLRGFGSFATAACCCTGFAARRQYFRARTWSGEPVSLAERRRRFHERWTGIIAEMAAA